MLLYLSLQCKQYVRVFFKDMWTSMCNRVHSNLCYFCFHEQILWTLFRNKIIRFWRWYLYLQQRIQKCIYRQHMQTKMHMLRTFNCTWETCTNRSCNLRVRLQNGLWSRTMASWENRAKPVQLWFHTPVSTISTSQLPSRIKIGPFVPR